MMRPVRTIALIEPFWDGHHSTYLRILSESLLSLGLRLMVFCPDPPALRELLRDHEHKDRVSYFEMHEPRSSSVPVRRLRPTLDAYGLWRRSAGALKTACAQTGSVPDLVFFPWLDSYLSLLQSRHLLDRLFPHNWAGLYFHPSHLRYPARVGRGPLDPVEALHASGCKAVGVLDEGVAPSLQGKLSQTPVVLFPDFADDAPPDRDFSVRRSILSQAGGRKIVSVLGSLEKRKGVLTLLEAARKCHSDEWFFVFAGRVVESSFDPEEMRLIRLAAAEAPANTFFHLEFIPDEAKFNALVEVSDVLFAAYDRFFHSSNVLTKGALFKKPVIVSNRYLMRERVEAYHLGAVIEYGNVEQCLQALNTLKMAIGSVCDLDPDFEGYSSRHSKQRLSLALSELIGHCEASV